MMKGALQGLLHQAYDYSKEEQIDVTGVVQM